MALLIAFPNALVAIFSLVFCTLAESFLDLMTTIAYEGSRMVVDTIVAQAIIKKSFLNIVLY